MLDCLYLLARALQNKRLHNRLKGGFIVVGIVSNNTWLVKLRGFLLLHLFFFDCVNKVVDSLVYKHKPNQTISTEYQSTNVLSRVSSMLSLV